MADQYVTLRAGLNHVGSYQVSGIPWATSSISAPGSSSAPLEISFPNVTRTILVKNVNSTSAKVRVGFSSNGLTTTNNYFLLDKDESFEGDIKITKLFLLSNNGSPVNVTVIASLTGIEAAALPNNWSGSSGVG